MNWVSNEKNPASTDVDMSNGTTDVVLAVLCLAGADLAETRWEKELMVWLAARDQSVRGRGCAFFDVDQLGWTRDGFEQQWHFVFQVIDRAIQQTGWEKLGYRPDREIVVGILKGIRRLVGEYSAEYVEEGWPRQVWDGPPPSEFSRCPRHGVYLHAHGCLICNDG